MTSSPLQPKTHRIFRKVQRVANWFDARYSAAGRLMLLALVVALIFSLDPRQTVAYQFLAVLLAIFCAAFAGAYFRRPDIDITRHLPQFFTVGETGDYRLEVSNQSNRLVRDLSLKDCLIGGVESANDVFDSGPQTNSWWERKIGFIPWLQRERRRSGARTKPGELFQLGPKETRFFAQTIQPLRRGVLQFDRVEIRATEALGLIRKVRFFPRADKIVALPARIALPAITWRSQRRLHRGGYSVASSVGDSQEFIGLRDYRPGDSLRQIHWRSFAKLGKPVIKEYQDEFFDHHALILGTHITAGQEELFESAVITAASFVDWTQSGDSLLDLVVVDDRTWRITTGRGINHKHQLLEHLAIVHPKQETDSRNDAERTARAVQNCGAVVLISCNWDFSTRRTAELIRQQGTDLLAIEIAEERAKQTDRYQLATSNLAADLTDILMQHYG